MQVFKFLFTALFFVICLGCNNSNSVKVSRKVEPPEKVQSYLNFQEHVVEKGESLYSISRQYKVSMSDIAIDNKLKGNQDVLIGRILKIRTKVNANDTQKLPTQGKLINPENISRNMPPSNALPNSNVKNFLGNVPYMLIPASTGYQSTIKGNVTKNFQTNHFGSPLQGIEIRSSLAQSVKAVHNGVVVFVAENFSSYGRSIAVANNRNELSFIYGLDSITVKVGDVVMKGGNLGTIASGKVLGLKILREGIFQDPGRIIPGIQ